MYPQQRLLVYTAIWGMIRGVLADGSSIPTCSLTQLCPQSAPCCSQYGHCGVGAYCLGGCDPRMSFSLDSCVPAPVCEDRVMPMTSLDRILDVSQYLGDPTTADWISQGEPVVYRDNVLLTMPAKSVGTVLASTVYMWYGNVKASLRTSRGAGVVTAFIFLSDVKDEIDYEFVGTELTVAQTNYYAQGRPIYVNSVNISLSDTFNNFHDYEIQWTPDSITWLIDGQVGRVKYRKDTWNETSQGWDYPQTPARVQLSLWPAGASSNEPGTIQWSGGPIDWNSQDIQQVGYDYAVIGQVSISCYQTTHSGVSYTYDSALATNYTVVEGNKPTVLKSFEGTGTDMNAGAPNPNLSPSVGATGTLSAPPAASTSAAAAQIPGGGSNGPGTQPQPQQPSNPISNTDPNNNQAPAVPSSTACGADGFSQNCGDSSIASTSASTTVSAQRVAAYMLQAAVTITAFMRMLLL